MVGYLITKVEYEAVLGLLYNAEVRTSVAKSNIFPAIDILENLQAVKKRETLPEGEGFSTSEDPEARAASVAHLEEGG